MLAEAETGVRVAGPADESTLLAAVKAMHADREWGLRYGSGAPLAFSEEKTRETIQKALFVNRNAPDNGQSWIGIVGKDGVLEGSVCLSIGSAFCSDDPILFEQWNFVLPEYRRSDNARLLIAFSTAMSCVLRLPLVLGVMSHVRTEAKCRLYQRSLGRPLGAVFLFNGDDDEASELAGA